MTTDSFFSRYGRYIIVIPILFGVVLGITAVTHHLRPRNLTRQAISPVTPTENFTPTPVPIAHIETPATVKAIYMTSWVGSNIPWRNRLVQFIDQSEINSIIIDIKDYSGFVTFDTQDPELKKLNIEEIRVPDLKEFIEQLHAKGIYTIARITVFQDPVYSRLHPEQAVQTSAGMVWKDRNGLSYIDPGSRPFWDHIIRIATAAANIGFDELNFDYVRFPTDGNMKDARFPVSGARLAAPPVIPTGSVTGNAHRKTNKEAVITEFFSYLHTHTRSLGVPISADLFGMTMTAQDDVNIGQRLESAAPYFDYICPMVYPSHYPRQFNGYANPAENPYEIVHFAMTHGADRLTAMGQNPRKLRPWLQDFNLGARYDATKVRAQIKATYDAGLTSWLIWDPRNQYTRDAYLPAGAITSNASTANAK